MLSWVLNTSKDRDSTTFLDSLFPYLTVLTVRKVMLNGICCTSAKMPFVMSLSTMNLDQSSLFSSPAYTPSQVFIHTEKISWPSLPLLSLLFSGLNDHRSQSFLVSGACSPLMMIMGLLCTWSSKACACLVLGSPALDTALQARSHQCWVENNNHLNKPIGTAFPNAAQEFIVCLCSMGILLAQIIPAGFICNWCSV